MIKVKNITQSSDITAQLLGLTDEHIHYFDQDHNQNAANSKKLGIHHLILTDFNALVTSAASAGIEIKIASGFRSFKRQLLIWNNKFIGKTAIKNLNGEQVNIAQLNEYEIIEAIMLYSALPGASRHHWGCEIDVYAPNLLMGETLQLEPWEYDKSGPMARLTYWLAENSGKFGFYLPYESYKGGVAAEPWHLSYAPLAKQYQSSFSLTELRQCLLQADIKGKETIIEHLSTIFKRFITNVNSDDS